jgi:hypothetical protein
MPMSFGIRDWEYQSYLLLPSDSENASQPGTKFTAKKWAKGKLHLEDAIDNKPDAVGILEFPTAQGSLKLTVKAELDQTTAPAKFEAIGEVKDSNSAKGARYALVGWAFSVDDGKVAKITGSVIAERGPDLQPDKELGGEPIGTVGLFTITKPR